MDEQGTDAILNRIGADATGMRFNSIVSIEVAEGARRTGDERPGQPGARLPQPAWSGRNPREHLEVAILSYYSDFAGRPLAVNKEVFDSEAATNQRNQAIGYLNYAYGYIKAEPMRATDIYTEQCSVSVNAKDLAMMAASLAFGGKNPVTGKQVEEVRERPRGPGGDGDRRPLRDRQVALPHGAAGQERRRRRTHRRLAPASSASPSSRRRSTRRATASRRRRPSPTSRTPSAAIRTQPGESDPSGEEGRKPR